MKMNSPCGMCAYFTYLLKSKSHDPCCVNIVEDTLIRTTTLGQPNCRPRAILPRPIPLALLADRHL